MMQKLSVKGVVWLALLLLASPAWGQTGISDDRVSLPEGPGSLEGIGENIDVDGNMGTMRHQVQIEVPQGFPGVTPELSLSYNSGAGGSVVGMGWTLDTPYVERMTYRGLPRYVRGDDFAADGGNQLVELPGSSPPTYRARYEGSFVRYTWLDAGQGAEGYWRAEYPDGRVGYFGATAEGTLVPEARVSGPDGTFRYMLVEMVDVYDHSLRYQYVKNGAVSLVSQIGYVYTVGQSPRYRVEFSYEDRMDVTGVDYLSDAKPGFDERLTWRMNAISVFSGSERIRQYQLSYEPYADSGGFTRLAGVQMVGLEGGVYPLSWSFAYSQALGGVCDGQDCQRPFVVQMGSLGVDISTGRATLIDINGDALPDVVDTSEDGPHRFFLNVMEPDGSNHFAAEPVQSAVGTRGGHPLDSGYVQVLDLNGDGFTDMINAQTGQALLNRGQGDWLTQMEAQDTRRLPDFGDDFDGDDLQTIRFFDYDNDKRIDVIQSNQTTTTIYRNLGAEGGFVVDEGVMPIGAGFREDNLQTADMNGDGMLDMVKLNPGQLSYRINEGWGRWSDWFVINGLPLGEDEVPLASLEDLNGDALADLVVVLGNQIKYAINRNGVDFQDITTLGGPDVEGQLPQRDETVTVLYADMNGNGSSDIVWINTSGAVTFLELFPVRPNQLSRIENGLGMVREVTYSTSVQQMARDPEPWTHKLPHPMLVVERLDEYDLLTDVHDVTVWSYRDGFYDGVEKQFRGYEGVQTRLLGDDSQEEGLTTYTFDVGAQDTYRKGLMLRQSVTSAGRPLRQEEKTYEDCPLEGIPQGTDLPIRYLCPTVERQVMQEGAAPADYVTQETRMQYDGYGNVVLRSELGVVPAQGACAPCGDRPAEEFGAACGAQCLGDERYTAMDFVPPTSTGGRWMLRKPWRERSYGAEGAALVSERMTYYDGDAFEGLPAGNLTQGKVSRVTLRVEQGSQDVILAERSRHDEHGNVIETVDPNGDPAQHSHRRQYAMDDEGLRVVQTDILLEDAQGQPYVLRRETQYEPVFDKPVESTAWMRVVNGQNLSSRRSSFYTYDEFARPTSRVMPGQDTVQSPTEVYEYDLGNPSSRVIVRKRSQVGGPLDQQTVRCVDGRGRTYQERTRLQGDSFQVSGFSIFNVKSEPREVFQPYLGQGDQCDLAPPSGVLSTRYRRDAARRVVWMQHPDADLYGSASLELTRYEPLAMVKLDGEDSDPNSPHHDTPMVQRQDGLGRLVSMERWLSPEQPPAVVELRYNGLGHLVGFLDPEGNRKVQRFDLLGRVLEVQDPNKEGSMLYTYDDAGNVIEVEDGRGVAVVSEFDGANRPLRRYEQGRREETLISWTYDFAPDCDPARCTFPEGRLARVSYPDPVQGVAVDEAGYDVRGRTVFHGRTLGGVSFPHSMAYDNSDRQVRAVYPDGQSVERAYDDASRLAAITGVLPELSYDARGLRMDTRYADGTHEERRYDERMRMGSMSTLDAGGDILQGFAYTRDRADNLMEIQDRASQQSGAPRYDAQFTYDAWYRLTDASVQLPQGPEQLSFSFDLIDNVLAQDSSLQSASRAHQGDYTYGSDAPNALTQLNGARWSYDAEGQLTQRGDLELEWDFLHRLVRASRADQELGRFSYGPDQRRVSKVEDHSQTLYLSPDFELRDGISTLYVRVDRQRVARLQNDDLATVVLPDLAQDEQINAADAWLAHARAEGLLEGSDEHGDQVDGLLMSSLRRSLLETGPAEVYLHSDHLGSLTLATAQGAAVGQRAFYPTGLERPDGWGHVDRYGFTGQELDASTQLVHFEYRYLDPAAGRWISVDPLFSTSTTENILKWGESTTAYAYVGGNFSNAYDPTGLSKPGSGGAGSGGSARRAPASSSGSSRAVVPSGSGAVASPGSSSSPAAGFGAAAHASAGAAGTSITASTHGDATVRNQPAVLVGVGQVTAVSTNGDVTHGVIAGVSGGGNTAAVSRENIYHADGTQSTRDSAQLSGHVLGAHAGVGASRTNNPNGSVTYTVNADIGVGPVSIGGSVSYTTSAPQ